VVRKRTKQLLGLVIGGRDDYFFNYVVSLFEDFGVDYLQAEDVYSAVAELAAAKGSEVIAVGRIELLAEEQGTFFDIARNNSAVCCCFVEGDIVFGLSGIAEATEAGAIVIQQVGQLDPIISSLLARNVGESLKKNAKKHILIDDFRCTEEEFNALLGAESDDEENLIE